MKTKIITSCLLVTGLLLGATQSSLAGPPKPPLTCDLGAEHKPVHACTAELYTLYHTIGGATFAKDRDGERLLSKVCAADGKLHSAKPYDADQKLGDIVTKIEGLLTDRKEKINEGDAKEIISDAGFASECILGAAGTF